MRTPVCGHSNAHGRFTGMVNALRDKRAKDCGTRHEPALRLRRPAFTLVELLVVVAIIGLLVTIVMPAVSRARDLARVALCKTNLHHVGRGCVMYRTEDRANELWLFATATADYPWEGAYRNSPMPHNPAMALDADRAGNRIGYVSPEAFFCPLASFNYEDNYERVPDYYDNTSWGTYIWLWQKVKAEDDTYDDRPWRYHTNEIRYVNDVSKDVLMVDYVQGMNDSIDFYPLAFEHYNALMRDGSVILAAWTRDEALVWLWGPERHPWEAHY